jgi:hypothetical protein
MARPATLPDANGIGGGEPTPLLELAEIERCWRDALSHVAHGEARAAQAEVEAASALLERLAAIDRAALLLDHEQVAEFARRMQRLAALHRELIDASRRRQEEIAEELRAARSGRAALHAYVPARATARHACDEVG